MPVYLRMYHSLGDSLNHKRPAERPEDTAERMAHRQGETDQRVGKLINGQWHRQKTV